MKRILQFVVLGTVLGMLLSAFFIWIVNWFPTEGSPQAKNEFPLFIAMTYISFIILAVVLVAMGYSLWKFRQRGPSDLRDGDPTHGNTLLEIVWTAIPLVIVAVFAAWGAIVLDDNEAHAQGSREITVIGYSFGFDYRYDSDGGFTRNDGLYVPVDETITMHMITPRFQPNQATELEVIHSWWVPEWGVKQDATPGSRERGSARLGHAHARRHVRGAMHRAVRIRPRHHVLQEHPRAPEGGVRGVARQGQAGTGRGEAGSAGESRPGGLRLLGLRRLHAFTPAKTTGNAGPKLDDLTASFDEAKAAGKTKATDLAGFIEESIVERTSSSPRATRPASCLRSSAST